MNSSKSVVITILACVLAAGGAGAWGYMTMRAQVNSAREETARVQKRLDEITPAAADVVKSCSKLATALGGK